MKILFYGDSITDAGWERHVSIGFLTSYGFGYVRSATGALLARNPKEYNIINRGRSGDKIVDLYARMKVDVWNHQPDVLSILVGINDVWQELIDQNGVDLERFERVYRMSIEDTLARLPKLKIILCEPFVLEGSATRKDVEKFELVKQYAKVVKKLAEEYGCYFLPLQESFEQAAEKYGAERYLYDGVHPTVAGSELIAGKWIKLFDEEVNK